MQRQMVQPALPRQIGGGVDGRGMLQPGGRSAFHTTRSAHLPTHYYLNLYLKPLAGESATLRISADTYQALARAQRIRIEYWRHSATLKRFEILDATP